MADKKIKPDNGQILHLIPISLLGIVCAYLVNRLVAQDRGLHMLLAGVFCLFIIAYYAHRVIISTPGVNKYICYALALCMFSSIVDTMIGLENDQLISGFMTSYLKTGEPYLTTAHGTMICYYDGLCHYAMYLGLVYCCYKRMNWKMLGLYWVGSIGNSMIVFIPGNFIGQHSIHPSILLNIPYIIIPIVCGTHFFNLPLENPLPKKASTKSFVVKVIDFFFCLSFVAAILISVFRGFAVLSPERYAVFSSYLEHVEPYLLHSDAYPKMQVLTYLYYFLPLYVVSLFWLVSSEIVPSILEWVLIMAGASLQAQISHIGSSLRSAKDQFKVCQSQQHCLIFYSVNLFLLILPHLFLARVFYETTASKTLPPSAIIGTKGDDHAVRAKGSSGVKGREPSGNHKSGGGAKIVNTNGKTIGNGSGSEKKKKNIKKKL